MDFAAMMKALMDERGLGVRALARKVPCDPAHISRLASGKQRPSRNVAQRLDAVLVAGGRLLACAAAVTSAPVRVPADDWDDVKRRMFLELAGSTALAAGLGAPPQITWLASGRRVGPGEAARLAERTARLRHLDDYLGGADTYLLYAAEFQATVTLLRNASCTQQVRAALQAVTAEQAQQAGWAAFDAGWLPDGRRLLESSRTAALDAGNSALAANALCHLAYLETGTGRGGAATAAAACGTAGRHAPPAVRALLYGRLAWAHAWAGQATETDRALQVASSVLNRPARRPDPDWASWYSHTESQIMAGRCWTVLHRPAQAVPLLTDALAGYDGTHAREKALYLSWLAEAHLHAGEPGRAAAVTSHALDLAAGVASARPRQRLAAVLAMLRPYQAEPAVAEALDQAAALPMPAPLPSGPPTPSTAPTLPR